MRIDSLTGSSGWRITGIRFFSVAAAAAVMFAGCQTSPIDRVPGFIENVTPNDIPLPRDFYPKVNGENWEYIQFSSGPGKFRSWVGEYVGYKQIRDLTPWYERQMAQDGWVHKGTQDHGVKRILTFVNANDEQAIVTLDRAFNLQEDRFQTIIRCEIGPLPTEEKDVEEILRKAGLQNTLIRSTETKISPEEPQARAGHPIPATGSGRSVLKTSAGKKSTADDESAKTFQTDSTPAIQNTTLEPDAHLETPVTSGISETAEAPKTEEVFGPPLPEESETDDK